MGIPLPVILAAVALFAAVCYLAFLVPTLVPWTRRSTVENTLMWMVTGSGGWMALGLCGKTFASAMGASAWSGWLYTAADIGGCFFLWSVIASRGWQRVRRQHGEPPDFWP